MKNFHLLLLQLGVFYVYFLSLQGLIMPVSHSHVLPTVVMERRSKGEFSQTYLPYLPFLKDLAFHEFSG